MHGSVRLCLVARCGRLYALLGFTEKDPLAELSLIFYSIGFMSRMNIDDNLNNKRQRWLSKVVPVFYNDNIDNWGVFYTPATQSVMFETTESCQKLSLLSSKETKACRCA